MGNREVHKGSAFDSERSLREKDGYIQALNSKRNAVRARKAIVQAVQNLDSLLPIQTKKLHLCVDPQQN